MFSLVANTIQKHRWFFNCKCTSEVRHSTHLYARSLKGICIYPFHEKNLKESSYNLTIGQNAWSLGNAKIIKCGEGKYKKARSNDKKEGVKTITKGASAVVGDGKNKYLILLPHTTTIVETSEVVGVDHRIGGTIHSKVGVVAQGIGDTSTMLGPCFCGHLMISLHNTTDDIISLLVGDTIVSLIFYHLETPNEEMKNGNMSGHVDKLSELGITINRTTREFLLEDWKQNIDGIRDKLISSQAYLDYKEKLNDKKHEHVKRMFTVKNIILSVLIVVIIAISGIVACRIDASSNSHVWVDRYWTLISACLIIPFFKFIIKLYDK